MKNVYLSLVILCISSMPVLAEDLAPPALPGMPEIDVKDKADEPEEAYKSMPPGSFPPEIEPEKPEVVKVKSEVVKSENAQLPTPTEAAKPADEPKIAAGGAAPPPLPNMDQFFSDTPLPTLAPYKKIKKDDELLEVKAAAAKKIKPAKPFVKKMVKLSPEVYSASYDVKNTHLPKAVYHENLQQAVIVAVKRGDVNALIALRNFGISLDNVSAEGEPVLVIAARYGHTQTVKYLLQQKIWVDAKDGNGLTALHYASFMGFDKMVDALLSAGANPNQADSRGVRPVVFAQKSGHFKTAELLFRRGASS